MIKKKAEELKIETVTNLVWRDENKFELFRSKRRIYVSRKPGSQRERRKNECRVPACWWV